MMLSTETINYKMALRVSSKSSNQNDAVSGAEPRKESKCKMITVGLRTKILSSLYS